MYITTVPTHLYLTGLPGVFRQRPQAVLSATTTFEAIAAQKPLQVNLHSGMTWCEHLGIAWSIAEDYTMSPWNDVTRTMKMLHWNL